MGGSGRGAHRDRDQPALPIVAAIALLGCSVADPSVCTTSQAKEGVKTYMVTIEGLRFNPATLAVTSGDRIVWINKDPFPHTVTANAKSFDSQNLAADSSWGYVTRIPGEYAYGCTYHPSMKAILIVRAKPSGIHRT
jgi:plastocyanin